MAEAIQTVCKFRVVGVEDTEYVLTERVYSDHPDYHTMFGVTNVDSNFEVGDSKRLYKYKKLGRAQNVRLAASYDISNPEDLSFSEATPSGKIEIYVSNPKVIGTFTPGKNYKVILIPCE